MADALIAAVAAAQVHLIQRSLTGSPAAVVSAEAEFAGGPIVSWAGECVQAAGLLRQLGRGTPQHCTVLVWREVDLITDLSTQRWWSNPRLRQAAVGEIAWTTAAGRWRGSVTSAAAQRQWEESAALIDTIQRRLATTTGRRRAGRRRRADGLERVLELRRRWEDAWWTWATACALSDLEGRARWATGAGPRGSGTDENLPASPPAGYR
jgi:hypothetical protein